MPDLDELMTYLPHKEPVAFVKKVLVSEEHNCRVSVSFETAPTLSMLSEAGAQASIFLLLTEEKAAANIPPRAMGMLLSVKSKWHQKSEKTVFEIESRYISNLENFFMVSFRVFDGESLIAEGQLSVVLQKEGDTL
ncbi:hypothetical protein [Sulfurimonas sp. HSL3-7]|uniref:hypothetical protein n=1 Tax=Sulfonitrofixus jiaomeiensis TaxID=3131938 RepID=UPI0031F75B50